MTWKPAAAVGFRLEGQSYRFDPQIAGVDLAAAAAAGQWTFVVPEGLVEADRARLLSRVGDPGDWLDIPHLYGLALMVARQVYGVEWHVASRLCGVAEAEWAAFYGWCTARGQQPRALTAEQVCALVWAWLLDRTAFASGEDQGKVREQVWGPADNQLALIRAGIHLPVSAADRERQEREWEALGLPTDGVP